MKEHINKTPTIRLSALTWLHGKFVDNAFYVFSVIFHSPPLKSSQKFTFDGQIVIFFYYRKHPNTSLHLSVIDFTILDRIRTFRTIFFFLENVILSPFHEI